MESADNLPDLNVVKPDVKEPLIGEKTRDIIGYVLESRSRHYDYVQGPTQVPGCKTSVYVDLTLSSEECAYLCNSIEQSESLTFWNADQSKIDSARLFRDADTIEIFSEEFASFLWSRIVGKINLSPIEIAGEDDSSDAWERELVGTWIPAGLNADMLFARYKPGGHFAPHTDGRAIKGAI